VERPDERSDPDRRRRAGQHRCCSRASSALPGFADVEAFDEPEEALGRFEARAPRAQPFDLVCTDLHMPRMSGAELIERIRAMTSERRVPAAPRAHRRPECRSRAGVPLSRGQRLRHKPFRPAQIRLRVTNLLRLADLQRALRRTTPASRPPSRSPHGRARGSLAGRAREARNGRGVPRRTPPGSTPSGWAAVWRCSPRQLGCDVATAELIRRAAPLHDVGKIAIPDHILLKPGPLTPQECRRCKSTSAPVRSSSRGGARSCWRRRDDRAHPPRALGRQRLPAWVSWATRSLW
jgi:CheY-like chemotaxis protein